MTFLCSSWLVLETAISVAFWRLVDGLRSEAFGSWRISTPPVSQMFSEYVAALCQDAQSKQKRHVTRTAGLTTEPAFNPVNQTIYFLSFQCAAIVSVIQANCYTLVLGGITGPSQNAPLNNVKLEITGNSLPGNATSTSSTSPPFEIDVYSVAVVGVNRTSWLADVQRRTDLVSARVSFSFERVCRVRPLG